MQEGRKATGINPRLTQPIFGNKPTITALLNTNPNVFVFFILLLFFTMKWGCQSMPMFAHRDPLSGYAFVQ